MIRGRNILLCLLFCLTTISVLAQDGLLFYMKNVPHAYQVNPANQPNYKFFIGAPFLSSSNFEVRTNAVTFTDFIQYDKTLKTPVLPIYSDETKAKFLANFHRVNYLSESGRTNIISFGAKLKKSYFIVDMSLRNHFRFSYPGDMVEFLMNGNPGGDSITLGRLNFDGLIHFETGIAISKKINDKLTIGIHPKYLSGFFTAFTRRNESILSVDYQKAVFQTNLTARIGLPHVPGTENYRFGEGEYGIFPDDGEMELNAGTVAQTIFSNPGLGIDLGAHYKLLPKLELSASLLDLGFIRFNGSTYSGAISGAYEFEGVELNIGDTTQADYVKEFIESFEYKDETKPFTRGLRPQLYLGGQYSLLRSLDVGLVSKTAFYYKSVSSDLHLSAHWRPIPNFSLSTGYHLFQKGFGSFSMGLGYKLLLFNGYFLTETIPFRFDKLSYSVEDYGSRSLLVPVDFARLNFRFGLNIAIGNVDENQ